MTTRLAAAATTDDPRLQEELFNHRADQLADRYRRLWWETSCDLPRFDRRFEPSEQRRNTRLTEELVDRFSEELQSFPDARDRNEWQESVRTAVAEYTATCLGWTPEEQESLLADDLFDVTRQFASEVRDFDPTIESQDLFQALRNVWIMNVVQLLLGCEVALTPSVFAYSMLYPYTDNPLDSADLDGAAKRGRSLRLERRLRGCSVRFEDEKEDFVFRLVGRIEGQYNRSRFPEVFHSLLAIHRAQSASLRQQNRPSPYEEDLLGISIAKGGASVLADGYLTAGYLSEPEADFLFGYGVLLQFLDDLQDVGEDRAAGHMTVFSQTAGGWPLDRITSRLANFGECLFESNEHQFQGTRSRRLWQAIRRNTTQLFLQSVGTNRQLFSEPYVKYLEPYSPLPFSSLDGLKRRALRRRRQIESEWRKRSVSLSTIEALLWDGDSIP